MKPDCILIRVGEQALKSDQVLRIFDRIFVRNIKASLKGIDYKLKKERNRFFIYTKDTEKTVKRLKKIFGITSLSPCYVCDSNIEDMQKLSKKIFKPKKTFAVRARRTGSHKFTSIDINKEVGHIIPGKADLTNPDKELFIECRQKKTYIFTEKIKGPGGLPLGASGKVLGILKDKEDLVACWLLMKRGCEILVISDKKPLISKLKKWYIGPKLEVLKKMPKKQDITGIVLGEKSYKSMRKKPDMLILLLRPLVGFNSSKIIEFFTLISE